MSNISLIIGLILVVIIGIGVTMSLTSDIYNEIYNNEIVVAEEVVLLQAGTPECLDDPITEILYVDTLDIESDIGVYNASEREVEFTVADLFRSEGDSIEVPNQFPVVFEGAVLRVNSVEIATVLDPSEDTYYFSGEILNNGENYLTWTPYILDRSYTFRDPHLDWGVEANDTVYTLTYWSGEGLEIVAEESCATPTGHEFESTYVVANVDLVMDEYKTFGTEIYVEMYDFTLTGENTTYIGLFLDWEDTVEVSEGQIGCTLEYSVDNDYELVNHYGSTSNRSSVAYGNGSLSFVYYHDTNEVYCRFYDYDDPETVNVVLSQTADEITADPDVNTFVITSGYTTDSCGDYSVLLGEMSYIAFAPDWDINDFTLSYVNAITYADYELTEEGCISVQNEGLYYFQYNYLIDGIGGVTGILVSLIPAFVGILIIAFIGQTFLK